MLRFSLGIKLPLMVFADLFITFTNNARREGIVFGKISKHHNDYMDVVLKNQYTYTIEYFKKMADETGIAYQTLINIYRRDCTSTGRRLDMRWK